MPSSWWLSGKFTPGTKCFVIVFLHRTQLLWLLKTTSSLSAFYCSPNPPSPYFSPKSISAKSSILFYFSQLLICSLGWRSLVQTLYSWKPLNPCSPALELQWPRFLITWAPKPPNSAFVTSLSRRKELWFLKPCWEMYFPSPPAAFTLFALKSFSSKIDKCVTAEEAKTLHRHDRCERAGRKESLEPGVLELYTQTSPLIKKDLLLSMFNLSCLWNGPNTHAHELVLEDKYGNVHGIFNMASDT